MFKESGTAVHQPFKHYLVLDFEATCQKGGRIDPQEIIEFPCLLVRADDLGLIEQVDLIYLASIPIFQFPFKVIRLLFKIFFI